MATSNVNNGQVEGHSEFRLSRLAEGLQMEYEKGALRVNWRTDKRGIRDITY